MRVRNKMNPSSVNLYRAASWPPHNELTLILSLYRAGCHTVKITGVTGHSLQHTPGAWAIETSLGSMLCKVRGNDRGTNALARTIVPWLFWDWSFLVKNLLERVGPKQLHLVPFIVPGPGSGTMMDLRTRSRSHPKVGTE